MGTVHWETDPRPARAWTRLYVAGMWAHRDKQAFEGEEHTRERALALQRRGDHPPTAWTRRRVDVVTRSDHAMTLWVARPRRRDPVARVLYLHGGGYVHPLTPDYWRLVRALVGAPAEVVVPAYPLAPRHHVDDVLPHLVDLAEEVNDLPLVIMGDSAGGALTLAIGQQLRDRGIGPASLVLLSPWLDATLDEEEVAELEATDPMLAESGLRAAGRWWAGPRSAADPLVSPVAGDLDDVAPIDLFVGAHDILRPAVDGLARAVEQAEGTSLAVHERTAMFHVWMTRAIPEAAQTRRDLVALVRRAAS